MEKHACTAYSSEEISRFVDQELPAPKIREIGQHIEDCPACLTLAQNFSSLSQTFSRYADRQVAGMDSRQIREALNRKVVPQTDGRFSTTFSFMGKHLYLKLATLAAILMISVVSLQYTVFSPAGPSAIVKSVDTDFASVMIIETQKEKHTIIWFSET